MQRLLWRAFLPEKAARAFLQQQNHFLGSAAAAKNRLKPGLCSCSANARRPDRPGSGSYRDPALASKNHPLFSACHDIGNAKSPEFSCARCLRSSLGRGSRFGCVGSTVRLLRTCTKAQSVESGCTSHHGRILDLRGLFVFVLMTGRSCCASVQDRLPISSLSEERKCKSQKLKLSAPPQAAPSTLSFKTRSHS